MGDARATIANSPYTFDHVTIVGELTIEPNVTITFRGPNLTAGANVVGSLSVGAGATLLCNGVYMGLHVLGSSVIGGTAVAPVRFERRPSTGYTFDCRFDLGAAKISYARFTSIPLFLQPDSQAFDSIFEASPTVGGGGMTVHSWVVAENGTTPTSAVFQHNTFLSTRLTGKGFTARLNRFGVTPGVPLLDTQYPITIGRYAGGSACAGSRTTSAQTVITSNAFIFPAGQRVTALSVERAFGPVDFTGNYFSWFATLSANVDSWDGTTAGCSDGLGAYGGPVTLAPTLTSSPDAGPR